MSGSNSSVPGVSAVEPAADRPEALSFAIHSLPAPSLTQSNVANGRLKMLLVLLVCAAPVIASYVTYYLIRPQSLNAHGELIQPLRPLPSAEALPLSDDQGRAVPAASLKGQWLLIAVGGGACDAVCERQLYLQRQLREALGKSKERVDRVWFVDDDMPVREALRPALAGATVLGVPRAALAQWLDPADPSGMAARFYLVDPMGNLMMRFPAPSDPTGIRRDLERLLRASASWDEAGR